MTRAMAVVLLVAGSLVVIACGAATFLRYRRDDDDDDDDADRDRRAHNDDDRTTVMDAGVTTCITASGNYKTADGSPRPAETTDGGGGALLHNVATPNAGLGKAAADKEYLNGGGNANGGGRLVGGLRNSGVGRVPPLPAGVPGDGGTSDGSPGAPITAAPSHASPTSILRGTTSANMYGVKSLQQKISLSAADQPPPGLQGGRASQAFHRNPDIIPAPLMSPGGNVYNNYIGKGEKNGNRVFGNFHYHYYYYYRFHWYCFVLLFFSRFRFAISGSPTDPADPTDSMTLIMASSTSSSPIHNHRQQIHQHNNRYNNLGQYHQGVMTLRRPVVINTQYYGGGTGGTLQRNVLQQPDVSRVLKLRISSYGQFGVFIICGVVLIITIEIDLNLVYRLNRYLRPSSL